MYKNGWPHNIKTFIKIVKNPATASHLSVIDKYNPDFNILSAKTSDEGGSLGFFFIGDNVFKKYIQTMGINPHQYIWILVERE